MSASHPLLVVDIGGTNTRLAMCSSDAIALDEVRIYRNDDFDGAEGVIRTYMEEAGAQPARACVAVACPVTGDQVTLTNRDWTFSTRTLQQRLDLVQLQVVNDFTALAMSVPHLPREIITQVGGGAPQPDAAIGVLGAGTGLGVSGLLHGSDGWTPIRGEGGHVNFAPGNKLEIEILTYGWQHFDGFVSAERLLCGQGLAFIYEALAAIDGRPQVPIAPSEISTRALAGDCPHCKRTVDVFCGMLGSYAGNHALVLGAFGGMYIGGGVIPKMGELFAASPFRARFEEKGRFTDYVRAIPTYLIGDHPEAALYGAAAFLC